MTRRRTSAQLAAAVSAVLSAPAFVAGLAIVGASSLPAVAVAQETSTTIAGRVTEGDAAAISGANVTVTHVPSGQSRTFVTNAEGRFSATGLRVGGPFRIEIEREGYEKAVVDEVYTQLGSPTQLNLPVRSIATVGEVLVTDTRERDDIASGSEFTARDIANLPSVSRDIKDVIRIDPKIWIDPFNVDAIEIAGTNGRYNTITVDGIRQSDDFGLNNNGYPTNRSPVSLDAVEAISVQTAPYSVVYSNFQGGSINIVTKSGTNEFEGTAFYLKNSDSLTGDKSRDRNFTFDFEEETYGATFSGPILKDKLFFMVNYEKADRTAPADFGPTGSGFPAPIPGVTLAEFQQVAAIMRGTYNFDPLDPISTLPEEDEKSLVKLDWQINDNHRASLAYQETTGFVIVDGESSVNLRRYGAPSNAYARSQELVSYSLQVYSNWSDRFATEFKAGRKEVVTGQDALQGDDFALFRIRTPSGGEIYLGPDESRHANALTNDLNQFKLKGDIFLGDHTVSLGVELEQLQAFNLFLQRTEGTYVFNSIADLAARRAASLSYQNALTNNEDDAAATFGYDTLTFYAEDKWTVTPDLTLTYGLRLDQYSSDDVPRRNALFQSRYGFSNQTTFDGLKLISPRLGFDWQVAEKTKLFGGVGLFGGGTPNVWLSNSYSNDGVITGSQTINRTTTGTPGPLEVGLDNVDGYNINPAILNAQTQLASGNGSVNAIDPNFKIPSSWRYNLGVQHFFDLPVLGEDFRVSADIQYTKVKDAINYQDLNLVQTATAPDGRPIFSRRVAGRTIQDFLLTRTSGGKGLVFTVDLDKTWRTAAGRFDAYLGFARQDIEDVNPGTNSTASSNWDYLATYNPNDPALATSNYEIKNRFVGSLNWRKAFFGEYETQVGLFLEHRAGRPYSYTFGAGTTAFGDPRQGARQRQLFYVPLNDSDVGVEGGLTYAQLNEFIADQGLEGYRGQIAPRNGFRSSYVTTADLRLSQELPAFFEDARVILTLDIENLTNLLNKDWGRVQQIPFAYVAPVVDARIVNGRYVYRPIQGVSGVQYPRQTVSALSSVWKIQAGIKIQF